MHVKTQQVEENKGSNYRKRMLNIGTLQNTEDSVVCKGLR